MDETAAEHLVEALGLRHDRTGSPEDLDAAIALGRRLLVAEPHGARRSRRAADLASDLRVRYLARRAEADLVAALALADEALAGTDRADRRWPRRADLVGSLRNDRFQLHHDAHDLAAALDLHRAALRATSPDDPELPARRSNLAADLRLRFARDGEVEDVEEAVRLQREALVAIGDDEPAWATYAAGLAGAERERYWGRPDHPVVALDAAVDLLAAAADRADAAQELPLRDELADVLRERSEVSGDVAAELAHAVRGVRLRFDAVDRSALGDPDLRRRVDAAFDDLTELVERRRDAGGAPDPLEEQVADLVERHRAWSLEAGHVWLALDLLLRQLPGTDRPELWDPVAADRTTTLCDAFWAAATPVVGAEPPGLRRPDDLARMTELAAVHLVALRALGREAEMLGVVDHVRGASLAVLTRGTVDDDPDVRKLRDELLVLYARPVASVADAPALRREAATVQRRLADALDVATGGRGPSVLARGTPARPLVVLVPGEHGGTAIVDTGADRPRVLDLPDATTGRAAGWVAAIRGAAADANDAVARWQARDPERPLSRSAAATHPLLPLRQAVERTVDWLGDAVAGPLLAVVPGAVELVLLPCGPLALLPVHAARLADGSHLGAHVRVRHLPTRSLVTPPPRGPGGVTAARAGGADAVGAASGPGEADADDRAGEATGDGNHGIGEADAAGAGVVALNLLERPAAGLQVELAAARAYAERSGLTFAEVRQLGAVAPEVLHISAHGLAHPSDASATTYLADGRTGLRPAEGLGLVDLLRARLPARLVVTTSCQASRPAEQLPDDQLSLASALLVAGASGVVAALWDVIDVAAAALTDWFYEELSSADDPAEALADALVDMAEHGPRHAQLTRPFGPTAPVAWRELSPVGIESWAAFAYFGA